MAFENKFKPMKYKILFIGVLLAFFMGCKEEEERTSILGGWNCEEFGETTQPRVYQVNIIRNNYLPNATNEYIINNFNNRGISDNDEVYVRFNEEAGELIITGTAHVGVYYNGKGIVADDYSTIEWEYYVSDGSGVQQNFVATYY